MNKNLIISSIILLVILGGLGYWQYIKKPVINIDENTNINNEESIEKVEIIKTDIDTSNWETFVDEELGISYKHPADCWQNGAGPGTEATNAVDCSSTYLKYKPLGFVNLDIEEIANIYYRINKYNFDNPNKPIDRFISELSKTEINDLDSYNFSFDWGFQEPCPDNYEAYCGGGVVRQITEALFIYDEHHNKKMLLMFPMGDIISEEILKTFTFVE